MNHIAYFIEDGLYVEEFDTPDGQHWMATWEPEEWTPEIRRKKLQADLEEIPYL